QLDKGSRAKYCHTGDLSQISHILAAVVGGAIGPHQSCPVHRQHNMELLESHIVDQHIKAALEEGRIDGKYGDHPLLCHTGSHGNRVTLRDSYLNKAIG